MQQSPSKSDVRTRVITSRADPGSRTVQHTTRVVRQTTSSGPRAENRTVTQTTVTSSNQALAPQVRTVTRTTTRVVTGSPTKRTKISDIITGFSDETVTAREALLKWAQRSTERYPGVRINDFTKSWKDGLAFVAILHRNRPDLLDFKSLRTRQAKENLELAFSLAEKEFGITRLLDPEDVDTPEPDEKSLITYISSMYDAFPEPPSYNPFVDDEKNRKIEEYKTLARSLRLWMKTSLEHFNSAKMCNTLIDMKGFLLDSSKFRSEEIPKKLRDKQRLNHLYKDIQKSHCDNSHFEVLKELHIEEIEKYWNEFSNALQDRDKKIKDEICRLEKLQRLADKVNKDAKQCEGKLDDVERRVKEEEKRMHRLHSVDTKHSCDLIESELKTIDDFIKSMKKDIDVLEDKCYPQIGEIKSRIENLKDRYRVLTSTFQDRFLSISSRVEKNVEEKKITKQRIISNEKAELSTVTIPLREHFEWIEKKNKRLAQIEFGSDYQSVKSNVDQIKSENKTIEQYNKKINFLLSQKNSLKNADNSFIVEVDDLEHKYKALMLFSSQKLEDGERLLTFVQSASKELKWMADKEETEILRDWSAKNVNLLELEHYQEALTNDLERREILFNTIQNQGETLLSQNHPASKSIEEILVKLQNEWSWLLQLTLCLEIHLKHAQVYQQFFRETRESELWLKKAEEKLNTTFSKNVFSVDEGERYIKQMQELKEDLTRYNSMVLRLVNLSNDVLPLKSRRIQKPKNMLIIAICNYQGANISISKDDKCTLKDITNKGHWKVVTPSGIEGLAPGVCFIIPAPNAEAIEVGQSLKKKYDDALSLWTLKQRKLQINLILATAKVVKSWDLVRFQSMDAIQRESIMYALNSDVQKILEDSSDSEPALLKLKEEMEHCNSLFSSLTSKAAEDESDKAPKSVGRKLSDSITGLQNILNEKEKFLKNKLVSAIVWNMDSLQNLVIEHKDFEINLRSLEDQVTQIAEVFKSASKKNTAVQMKYDTLIQTWDKLWDLSNSYVEKLKVVEVALLHLNEASQIISSTEIQLASYDKMPSNLEDLRKLHDTLLSFQFDMQESQNVIDDVHESARKVKSLMQKIRLKQSVQTDVNKFENDAKKLVTRWDNARSQIIERLRSCEASSELLRTYKDKANRDNVWISETTVQVNSMKTVKKMTTKEVEMTVEPIMNIYSTVADRSSSIEETNAFGARYIREAKIYDLRLKHYKESLEEEHPSLDASLQKSRVITSGAEEIGNELDSLNEKYSTLTQTVLDYLEELKKVFLKQHKEKWVTIISKATPVKLRTFSSFIDQVPSLETTLPSDSREDIETRNLFYKKNSPNSVKETAKYSSMHHSLSSDYVSQSETCILKYHENEVKNKLSDDNLSQNMFANKVLYSSKCDKMVSFPEALENNILNLEKEEFFDLGTGRTMSIQDATAEGFIDQSFYQWMYTKCGLFCPGYKDELSVIQAMQKNVYDFKNKALLNPTDGKPITLTDAFHLGIIKRSGISTLSKMKLIKIKELAITEAIEKGFLDPKSGIFCDPLTGMAMNFTDAVKESYIHLSEDSKDECGLTLSETIDKNIINDQLGQILDPDSGKKCTIEEAVSKGILKSNVKEIFDVTGTKLITIPEALETGLLNAQNGTYVNVENSEEYSLKNAKEMNLVFKPLTLKDAFDKEYINEYGIKNPLTGKRVSILEALACGILDSQVKCIIDSKSSELISLPEALRRGVILPKGKYFDSALNRELDISCALNEGFITSVCQRSIFDIEGIKDVAQNELIGFNDALQRKIIDLNKEMFIDSASLENMPFNEAVSTGYIQHQLYDMLCKPIGIKERGQELNLLECCKLDYIDCKSGHLKDPNNKKSIYIKEAVERGIITPEGAALLKGLLNITVTSATVTRTITRFVDSPNETKNVLDNTVPKGIFSEVTKVLNKCDEMLCLDEEEQDNLFSKSVSKTSWSKDNMTDNRHSETISEKHFTHPNSSEHQISSKECILNDIFKSSAKSPAFSVKKCSESSLSSGKIPIKLNEKNLVHTSSGEKVSLNQKCFDSGSTDVASERVQILDLPSDGWFLNEAIAKGLFDAESGLFTVPGTDRLVSFEETIKMEIINPKSGMVIVPNVKQMISFDNALEMKILNSTGQYNTKTGKILSMKEAIGKKLIILSDSKEFQTNDDVSRYFASVPPESVNLNSEKSTDFETSDNDFVLENSKEICLSTSSTAIKHDYNNVVKNVSVSKSICESTKQPDEKTVVLRKISQKIIDLKTAVQIGLTDQETADIICRIIKKNGNLNGCENLKNASTEGRIHDYLKGSFISIREAIDNEMIDAETGNFIIPIGHPLSLPEALKRGIFNKESEKFIHPETGEKLNLREAIKCGIINPYSTYTDPILFSTHPILDGINKGSINDSTGKIKTMTGLITLSDALEKNLFKMPDFKVKGISPLAFTFPTALQYNYINMGDKEYVNPVLCEKMSLQKAFDSGELMIIPVQPQREYFLLDDALQKNLIDPEKFTFQHPISGSFIDVRHAMNSGLLIVKPIRFSATPAMHFTDTQVSSSESLSSKNFISKNQQVINSLKEPELDINSINVTDGVIDLSKLQFYHKPSEKWYSIHEAIKLQLLNPVEDQKIPSEKYSLSQAILKLYDKKSEMFFMPGSQKLVMLEHLVDHNIIDLDSVIFEVPEERILSLKDAIKMNVIDAKSGMYYDKLQSKRVSIIDAAKSGLLLLLQVSDVKKKLKENCDEGVVSPQTFTSNAVSCPRPSSLPLKTLDGLPKISSIKVPKWKDNDCKNASDKTSKLKFPLNEHTKKNTVSNEKLIESSSKSMHAELPDKFSFEDQVENGNSEFESKNLDDISIHSQPIFDTGFISDKNLPCTLQGTNSNQQAVNQDGISNFSQLHSKSDADSNIATTSTVADCNTDILYISNSEIECNLKEESQLPQLQYLPKVEPKHSGRDSTNVIDSFSYPNHSSSTSSDVSNKEQQFEKESFSEHSDLEKSHHSVSNKTAFPDRLKSPKKDHISSPNKKLGPSAEGSLCSSKILPPFRPESPKKSPVKNSVISKGSPTKSSPSKSETTASTLPHSESSKIPSSPTRKCDSPINELEPVLLKSSLHSKEIDISSLTQQYKDPELTVTKDIRKSKPRNKFESASKTESATENLPQLGTDTNVKEVVKMQVNTEFEINEFKEFDSAEGIPISVLNEQSQSPDKNMVLQTENMPIDNRNNAQKHQVATVKRDSSPKKSYFSKTNVAEKEFSTDDDSIFATELRISEEKIISDSKVFVSDDSKSVEDQKNLLYQTNDSDLQNSIEFSKDSVSEQKVDTEEPCVVPSQKASVKKVEKLAKNVPHHESFERSTSSKSSVSKSLSEKEITSFKTVASSKQKSFDEKEAKSLQVNKDTYSDKKVDASSFDVKFKQNKQKTSSSKSGVVKPATNEPFYEKKTEVVAKAYLVSDQETKNIEVKMPTSRGKNNISSRNKQNIHSENMSSKTVITKVKKENDNITKNHLSENLSSSECKFQAETESNQQTECSNLKDSDLTLKKEGMEVTSSSTFEPAVVEKNKSVIQRESHVKSTIASLDASSKKDTPKELISSKTISENKKRSKTTEAENFVQQKDKKSFYSQRKIPVKEKSPEYEAQKSVSELLKNSDALFDSKTKTPSSPVKNSGISNVEQNMSEKQTFPTKEHKSAINKQTAQHKNKLYDKTVPSNKERKSSVEKPYSPKSKEVLKENKTFAKCSTVKEVGRNNKGSASKFSPTLQIDDGKLPPVGSDKQVSSKEIVVEKVLLDNVTVQDTLLGDNKDVLRMKHRDLRPNMFQKDGSDKFIHEHIEFRSDATERGLFNLDPQSQKGVSDQLKSDFSGFSVTESKQLKNDHSHGPHKSEIVTSESLNGSQPQDIYKSTMSVRESCTRVIEKFEFSSFPSTLSLEDAVASGAIDADSCSVVISEKKIPLQKAIDDNLVRCYSTIEITSKNEIHLPDEGERKSFLERTAAVVEQNYKVCEENANKLTSWMKNIELKLAEVGSIKEQLPALHYQMNTVKILKEELENQQSLITNCLDQMRQLAQRGLEVLSKEEINNLQKYLISLKKQYDSVLYECERLLRRLTAAYEELQKFRSELSTFKEWLKHAQQEFKAKESLLSILSDLEKNSEIFKNFSSDVIVHQADLRFITMAAQRFIDESQEYLKALNAFRTHLPQPLSPIKTPESEIRVEVQDVTSVYHDLLNHTNKLTDTYAAVSSKYRSVVESVDKSKLWMQEIKNSSKAALEETLADEPSSIQAQLDKIKLINMEVIGQSRLIENSCQAVKVLSDTLVKGNIFTNETKCIENIISSLQEEYSELSSCIALRIKQLQTALIHSQGIQDALDRILKWIDESEDSVKSFQKPISLLPEKLEQQVKEFKILKSDVDNQKANLDMLYSSSKEVSDNSNPKLAKKVDYKMKDISLRFEKLCERISKRGTLLEEISEMTHVFYSLVSQFEEWSKSILNRIESSDSVHSMDVDGFSSVIEYSSNQRNLKKDDFEQMIKIGKALIARKEVDDITLIKDQIQTIENQWKNIGDVLNDKRLQGKTRTEQMIAYETLRTKVLDWLLKHERDVENFEPVALSLPILKKQSAEIVPILKEHSDYNSTIEKLNNLGHSCDAAGKAESPKRKISSPVKKTSSPTKKSPSESRSTESFSISPVKSQLSVQSPLSTASSGFSSRRSSSDNIGGVDELTPIQLQLSEINNRYQLLKARLTDRNQEIAAVTEDLKACIQDMKTLATFIDAKVKELPKEGYPSSKEITEKHMKKLKDTEEEIFEKNSEIMNIKSKITSLVSKRKMVKGASELSEDFNNTEKKYLQITESIKKQVCFLQDLKEFQDLETLMKNWLTQKQKMFQVLGPIASEPRMVSTQVQQVQVMRDEFTSQKSIMERLEILSVSIITYLQNLGSNTLKVSEQVSAISHIWDDLFEKLIEREKNLEAASGVAKNFQKNVTELQQKLQNLNDEFDSFEEKGTSSLVFLKKLIEMEDELETQRLLLSDVESVSEQLCDILSDNSSKSEIKYKLIIVEKSYSSLRKKTDNKKAEIESTIKEDKTFFKSCDDIQDWLNKMDSFFVSSEPISGDLQKLIKLTESYEPVYKELIGREHEVHLCLNKGTDMMLKLSAKQDQTSLKNKLDNIRKQWDKLKKTAVDRNTCLRSCLENCKNYQSSVENFIPWLLSQEEKIKELKPISLKRDILSKQIKSLQILKSDLSIHLQQFESIKNLGESILASCESDKDVIKKPLEELIRKWKTINTAVKERTQVFEDMSQYLNEYEEKIRDLQHSLLRLEDKLSSHDCLGDISRDPIVLDRLQILLKETVDMKNDFKDAKEFLKLVISKADENSETSEIMSSLSSLEKRHQSLKNDLEDRCTSLRSSQKVISVFTEHVKNIKAEINSLDEEFDQMRHVARDSHALEEQLKLIKVLKQRLTIVKQNFLKAETECQTIVKQDHIPESKGFSEQMKIISRQINRLEEHMKEQEIIFEKTYTRLETYHKMYSTVIKELNSFLKEETSYKVTSGDVEAIRSQQQAFKEFCAEKVIPLSKQVTEVNKLGQGLVQSATTGVNTDELEQQLEKINESWNILQESINEREKRLDMALLQSGKFQEALTGVEKWLRDTEEMVSNQKPPSADFKVIKAQAQEQKFLKKMLLDRQNSVISLKDMGSELKHSTKTVDFENAESLMKNMTVRFEKLISSSEERMTVLEKTIPVAQEFQVLYTSFLEWTEKIEKKLVSMSTIPVDEQQVKAMVIEHKKMLEDISKQQRPLQQLNSVSSKLKTVVPASESELLEQKVTTVTEKFREIESSSQNIGCILNEVGKGITNFTTSYINTISWIEKTTIQLKNFETLSVHFDKLQIQVKKLKALKSSLTSEKTNIDQIIASGEEIMKHVTGDDAIQMKEKLDSLNRKLNDVSTKLNERLKIGEESLPLVESFYSANNKLISLLNSMERSLKHLDSSALDIQAKTIKTLEESVAESREQLEIVNHTGPRLCQLSPGEGAALIEDLISRSNQRFEKVSEQVQRKAERIQLAMQRKYDIISDIDELFEWLQETEKQVAGEEGLSSEPKSLMLLLNKQKALNDEFNQQKSRVRDAITAAKKLMRESSSEDLSFIHEKIETLKSQSNNVATICQERLSSLEQALPLAQHFYETHSDLGQWLDEVEGETELLEAPALNTLQIKKQQDRNKGLIQSVHDHKPLVDKLNKTGNALTKLCKEEESDKLEIILESDNSRYNALRKILREHQSALEEALQATSQFSDKLEGMLSALTSTADQLHNAEPISAHPRRIQEQINDNKAVLQDLDKRTITLEAVKKAADDVIVKASAIDEPAVKDIKVKLDRLNDLWETIQTAAQNRGKSLEEALVAAEKFWDELTAVMKALKELQGNLKGQEPPAIEPTAVQQQQEVLEEIKQEITQTKPEVDHCRQAGHNLMQLCGEPDKPEVQKHIEDLDSVWENVTTLYVKREQNLANAMEKAMLFHDTLQNLLEFLDTVEERFTKLGAVATDITSVKEQISQLREFKLEVDPHMIEIESLNRQAQELMEFTSPDQAVAIREPLSDINKRWDDLLKSIVDRQQEMENTLLKLGQFQHALEELMVWISKTEKTLDELKPVFGDPQVIEVVLAKHKVITNDIQAHQTSVDTINRAGHEFVDSDRGSEDAKFTHNKLQSLNVKWQHLQNKATERYKELEDALKEAQQFHQDIQDLLMWLNDIDSQLLTSKPVGGLPETAKDQLNRFMDLFNELDSNRYKVESILQQGQNYMKRSGDSSTKTLQHNLRTLKQRWDSILNKSNDRKIKLEIALREATEFHEALQKFVEWLTSAEKCITTLEPVSRHMKSVLKQIEEHRNFQKDVGSHREVMLNLDKKGNHLKYFSQKQDVILIKNLLISVQHRWERIVSKAAERTRALDHGYKEAKEFSDAWTSLSSWLDEAENILSSTIPIGNDPIKIKKLLSKHKEFQRSLGAKQVTYDSTVKIGRTLKDKCPKQEVQLIQDMMDQLKSRWNKVCSRSVDRQRKLEEALLYSGQFKDAVLALIDWFDKSISLLSNNKPYHGDLDTVTALIDQHKSFEDELKNRGLSLESVRKTAADLKQEATSTDIENISTQIDELNLKWKTVSDLSEKKKKQLDEALKLAGQLYKTVHMLLEWLSDAENKLRFVGPLPEDEETTKQQIQDHELFLKELSKQEASKNETIELAQTILKKCHPDAISVIRHWITIIQSRWDEVFGWARQRDQRLRDHLLSLKDINDLLDILLAWLHNAESTLTTLEAEPLPDDLPTLEILIKDHQVFMNEMSKKQTDVEKISKAFTSKRHHNKGLAPSATKDKSKEKFHRTSTPTSSKTLNNQNDSDIKHPKAALLLEKWRAVWLLAMERQRRLQDKYNYLLELERIKHFDFNEWRLRYLGWMNNKKSRIMDQFKKIDKNNDGKVTKQEFIDGTIKSKFSTSRLEMERVADIFDRNGDGFIDTKEYIETLRPEREGGPKTEAEKIQDEVQRQVAKCTCVHRFKVYQVGEGKYRFGDSQKLRLVRILRSTVMVRVGGGWVALDEFLVKNDPCRAKGRTNLELREQFILAEGVSQSMAPFKPKPSPNSSVSSQSGTANSMTSTGPITKIREKSERSTPMRKSRSSAENSSDISGPSFSETDSFSNRSGLSRNTPSSTRLSPRNFSFKSSSRPSSRQSSQPSSRAPSDLSQDGIDDFKNKRKIAGNIMQQKTSTPSTNGKVVKSDTSKIPFAKKGIKQPSNYDASKKKETQK
ncbi:LOW QUALITY PROTEIN: microtubule-actin cross-linking factor 1, isoforms 1/2/3/4/5-like [Uloborus diversus]|uniref:LOW QUALITY PROTEIN: microtubule-actin cross-linking factor 1, isoforms 1/2/3/4/5-like n=1 Tax=Uloborus diversus TaxID=327109 RepID=UPI00240936DF|nr:LOW QUALITY PROTEIN: microtubule-actin cross-linking factor 1, isoforms 1/2/3/4/5-like [Uloborus diversus]